MNVRSCKKWLLTWFLGLISLSYVITEEQSEDDAKQAEITFKKLYKIERLEQLAAVQALLSLKTDDKKRKMIEAISEKIFTVVKKSKSLLETVGYIPGESLFPANEKIRDALSNILENTAFYGDILLRLPKFSQQVLKRNAEYNYLLKWSLNFSNMTRLVDDKTLILFSLVNQELNYTTRHDNYTNPYRGSKMVEMFEDFEKTKEKKKKPKPIRKGPRMSRKSGDL